MPHRKDDNPLGSYLRARRQLIDPTDHGLPADSRRRVAGLRREEVAELAGLSVSYYIRLEQGRDRHPSPSVLDALARVLQADKQGHAYLLKLCDPAPLSDGQDSLAEPRLPLVQLLNQWTQQGAMVLSRYRDVMAANPLAQAINPNFTPGTNLMREVFLDPAARDTYPDWDQVAAEGVAALRASVGASGNDAVRDELVAELSAGSLEFSQLWARHDAREKPSGRQRYRIPSVGTIELTYEPLTVPDSGGQLLYVFFAIPGTEDARLLVELANRTALAQSVG